MDSGYFLHRPHLIENDTSSTKHKRSALLHEKSVKWNYIRNISLAFKTSVSTEILMGLEEG